MIKMLNRIDDLRPLGMHSGCSSKRLHSVSDHQPVEIKSISIAERIILAQLRSLPKDHRISIILLLAAMAKVAIIAVALTSVFVSPTAAAEFSGQATVVDGDTLQIEGVKERIRLYGVDAPESKQTCDDARGKRYLCGSRSAEALAEIIGRNGRVQCFEEDRDRYGRIVAECVTPSNTVINAELVRQGWAVEYDDYSDGRYDQEEREAKKAKRGIWAGQFVKPSAWRRGARLASEQAATVSEQGAPSTKCLIKGNISGSGKIYHTPSSRSYEKTVIDEADGERWFCTEAEAKAAGWRAPRG